MSRLKDLVQAAGGTASWADESSVELLTTVVDSTTGRSASQRQTLPLRQGMLASYVVRPRDQLHFHKVFTDTGIGSVTVQGEVRFAGNYPIRRGEHLSEVLMRAGGLTSTAYPQGTVFLRKSAAADRAGRLSARRQRDRKPASGRHQLASAARAWIPTAVHALCHPVAHPEGAGPHLHHRRSQRAGGQSQSGSAAGSRRCRLYSAASLAPWRCWAK